MPVLLVVSLVPGTLLAQARVTTLTTPLATSTDGFSMVASVRELSNGKVLVSDPMEKSVHLVDLAAGTSVQVGREGQGPGEYGFPGELLPLPGDSTLLVDRINRRFLYILPGGKTGGTIPFPGTSFGLEPRGVDTQGRIYFQGSRIPNGFSGSAETLDSVPVLRWDRKRNVTDTVTYVKLPAMTINTGGNATNRTVMIRTQPFSPEDAWAVAPDGRVAVARVSDYHVDWFSPARQRTAGPAMNLPPVPVTEADREALRNQNARAPRMMVAVSGAGRSRTTSSPPPAPAELGEPDFPDFKPPFQARSAWMTPEGMLWVLRSRLANDPVPTIDVFDQRGNPVGQVKLPKDRRVVGFGAGTVYLARTDADDLQWLEKYRM